MRHGITPGQVVEALIFAAIAWRVLKRVLRGRRRGHSAMYNGYINSPQWRRVRKKALARAGYRCEHRGLLGRCNQRHGLQVHHLNYRTLGHEWDGQRTNGECLQVLCHRHHVRADVKRRRRLISR